MNRAFQQFLFLKKFDSVITKEIHRIFASARSKGVARRCELQPVSFTMRFSNLVILKEQMLHYTTHISSKLRDENTVGCADAKLIDYSDACLSGPCANANFGQKILSQMREI